MFAGMKQPLGIHNVSAGNPAQVGGRPKSCGLDMSRLYMPRTVGVGVAAQRASIGSAVSLGSSEVVGCLC